MFLGPSIDFIAECEMVLYMSLGAFFKLSCMGLKFDRVSPWADLKTNVVVMTMVPVETLIGVSPVFQPYISVTFPYTFGLVGVSPLPLPYTPVAIFSPRLRQKHQRKKYN